MRNKEGFTPTPTDRCDLQKQGGFTLVELLVSTTIFIVLISVATGVFIQTLRTQRIVTNLSEGLNNASFAVEQISREIRVGYGFEGSANNEVLQFTNSDGDIVRYERREEDIDGKKISFIGRCIGDGCSNYEPITSPDVNVKSLKFVLGGTELDDKLPPRVTLFLTVEGEKEIKINLQTTISSRIIDT